MSDIDILDTDDESFQDSGSEYLPYESNRSSCNDEVDKQWHNSRSLLQWNYSRHCFRWKYSAD